MANSVFYYSILDTEEINGEDAIPGFTSPRVELDREQDSIREAPLLPCTAPQIGSRSSFFKYKSKSQVSDETDIHYMTIHDRKVKILRTLKNF